MAHLSWKKSVRRRAIVPKPSSIPAECRGFGTNGCFSHCLNDAGANRTAGELPGNFDEVARELQNASVPKPQIPAGREAWRGTERLCVPKAAKNASARVSPLNNSLRFTRNLEVIQQIGVFHGLAKRWSRAKSIGNLRAILTNRDTHSKRALLNNLETLEKRESGGAPLLPGVLRPVLDLRLAKRRPALRAFVAAAAVFASDRGNAGEGQF